MTDPLAAFTACQVFNLYQLVSLIFRGYAMTYAFYETEKDFQQSAFVFVAMSLNESAGYLISDGNIAQSEELALFELINIARSKSFDSATKTALGMYANLVQEENDLMRISFGKGQ